MLQKQISISLPCSQYILFGWVNFKPHFQKQIKKTFWFIYKIKQWIFLAIPNRKAKLSQWAYFFPIIKKMEGTKQLKLAKWYSVFNETGSILTVRFHAFRMLFNFCFFFMDTESRAASQFHLSISLEVQSQKPEVKYGYL